MRQRLIVPNRMDHVYVQLRDDGGLLMYIKGVVRSP